MGRCSSCSRGWGHVDDGGSSVYVLGQVHVDLHGSSPIATVSTLGCQADSCRGSRGRLDMYNLWNPTSSLLDLEHTKNFKSPIIVIKVKHLLLTVKLFNQLHLVMILSNFQKN